jgi:hypothetical protein
MGDVEDLRARVDELERRVEILFTKTGAIDMEELRRDAPEPSEEVKQLVAEGKVRQAVKLYQEQTGADMAAAMGAIGGLADS